MDLPGLNISSLEGGFFESLAIVPPAPDFEYINAFHGGAEYVGRNLIQDKPTVGVVGAPTYGAGYARFTGMSNFLETFLPETTLWTYFAICRHVGAVAGTNKAGIIGNFAANGANAGSMMYAQSDSQIRSSANNSTTSAAPYAQSSGEVLQNWGFRVARCRAADIRYDNLTGGQNATNTLGGLARILSPATLRVGSVRSGNIAGVIDIAFAGIVSRDVTDLELARIYALGKAFAQRDGIVV